MKDTVNIRVKSGDHKRLKVLAAKKGITLTALISLLSRIKI
jgi:predicted HicB family RNase H-like nuclease